MLADGEKRPGSLPKEEELPEMQASSPAGHKVAAPEGMPHRYRLRWGVGRLASAGTGSFRHYLPATPLHIALTAKASVELGGGNPQRLERSRRLVQVIPGNPEGFLHPQAAQALHPLHQGQASCAPAGLRLGLCPGAPMEAKACGCGNPQIGQPTSSGHVLRCRCRETVHRRVLGCPPHV